LAEYDLIIKALAERYMSHIAALVRGGIEVHAERIKPSDKEAVAVKRTSDVLYKITEDNYEYIMLVEFQTRPDRNMAHRLLEYTAMHHRRYNKPVYPVVINLTGRGLPYSQYIFECVDLTVVNFNYRQINLQEMAGRDFLYRGPVGLLPLTPLMKLDDQLEKVLQKCADRLENEVPEENDRATLYLALGVMAALKHPRELITKMLEVSKMQNSPLFDGIREEWEAKGKAEGRMDTLIDMLEAKFGSVPDDLRSRLMELKDPANIKETIRKAVNAETISEFSRLLKN